MDQTNTIAIFALIVSFSALGWNIIRDLVVDRVKLRLEVAAGEVFPMPHFPGRAFFVDADMDPNKIITNPQIRYSITNMGRRPIVISKICGKYKKPVRCKKEWVKQTDELPKTLLPYEAHIELAEDINFIKQLKDGNVPDILVEDTKGKKWHISGRDMRRLKRTVDALNL